MRSTYSIVFLYLDGTLPDNGHRVSVNTKRLLNRLEKRGVPVILCSARNPAGIDLVSQEIVCYGGSLILDEDRAVMQDKGIEAESALHFKQYAQEQFPEVVVSTYLYGVWLVDSAENPLVRRDAEILRCQPLTGKLADAVQTIPHVHKLLCVGAPAQIVPLQSAAASRFPELQFLRSGAEYLEVLAWGLFKRTAVEAIQFHYQLRREEIVACGDHFVDLEMLQYAGLGISMGNAPEQVKAAADRVTAANDEEGVYIALKNLRFSPPKRQF